jgi:hypothetical protein
MRLCLGRWRNTELQYLAKMRVSRHSGVSAATTLSSYDLKTHTMALQGLLHTAVLVTYSTFT